MRNTTSKRNVKLKDTEKGNTMTEGEKKHPKNPPPELYTQSKQYWYLHGLERKKWQIDRQIDN